MNRETFDSLVTHFSDSYHKIQQERYENKEIKRLPTGGKQGVFSSHEERLFFVLYYLKTYPTFDVLGFLFGLSAGHAHDHVTFFMHVLKRALADQDKGTLKNPVFRRVLRVVDELLAGLYRHGSKMRVILYDSLCSVAVRAGL